MKFNNTSLDRFIWVGDMHVQKSNLEESKRLVQWIAKTSAAIGIPVLFAGDQYHEFGVAKVNVYYFWKEAYDLFKTGTVSLVGNHDKSLEDDSSTFMLSHSDQTLVIDKPTKLQNVLLMPFYRDNEKFIQAVQNNIDGCKWLFCHQEFNGCKYENGFYSSTGTDPTLLPQDIKVISGHIHKSQNFSNIHYLGSPRQFTRSDVDDSLRSIYVIDLQEEKITPILVPGDVCERFKLITIDNTVDLDQLKIPDSNKVFVDIKGSSEFIKKALKCVPGNVKTRTFEDYKVAETIVKESEGIPKAFLKYAMMYFNDNKIGTVEARAILNKIYEKCSILKGQ